MALNTAFAALALKLDASEAQVKFALMAGRFEDYTPVLKGSVLTTLRRMEQHHFATDGGVFGHDWPPLAPSTIASKRRAGLNRGTLIRSGALYRSLAGGKRTKDSITVITKFGIEFGTSLFYARIHQHTDGAGKGIIPVRLVIPEPMPREVDEQLQIDVRDYLIEGRIRSSE